MSISEPVRQGEQNTDDLELGEVMELLRARRRRVVLDYLEREEEARFADLVDYAAREIHGLGYSNDERKRLYVALYQNHLPKLDDYGVVEFEGTGDGGQDPPRGDVRRGRPYPRRPPRRRGGKIRRGGQPATDNPDPPGPPPRRRGGRGLGFLDAGRPARTIPRLVVARYRVA